MAVKNKIYQFYTADVFSDRPFGGNPLAVFPQAEGLNAPLMQKIAAEFNLSETAFVFPPQTPRGTRQVRIFTPLKELPFAGHPTVGTAFVLAATGEIPLEGEETTAVLEEGVGLVQVKIRTVAGKVKYTELAVPQLPQFGPEPPSLTEIASILSLDPADLLDGELWPQAASCGVPFLFVPVRDRTALAGIRLQRELWQQRLAGSWAASIYAFTPDAQFPGHHWRGRMFAPALGIEEDPATGSAVAALAGYLAGRHPLQDGTLQWAIEQGFEMGRPSLLGLQADKLGGKLAAVRVGGASVLVSEGTMNVVDL